MARQVIEFDDEVAMKVNQWRAQKMPMPSFKEAVVQLVKEALKNGKS